MLEVTLNITLEFSWNTWIFKLKRYHNSYETNEQNNTSFLEVIAVYLDSEDLKRKTGTCENAEEKIKVPWLRMNSQDRRRELNRTRCILLKPFQRSELVLWSY